MGEERRTEVVIGILADPGLPSDASNELVKHLPDRLRRVVSDRVTWRIQLQHRPLSLDAQGNIPIAALADAFLPQKEWDILLCVTDLPRRVGFRPVLADVSFSRHVALASVPALGGLFVRRRLRDILVYLVAQLGRGGSLPLEVTRIHIRYGGRFVPVRWLDHPTERIDASLVLDGLVGRSRLLMGMVKNNHPWRLVPELSTTLAAGFATAAFGIFYSSIWNLADFLSWRRLALISVLAVAAMVFWMTVQNDMWEKRKHRNSREEAVMYNVVTIVTMVVGIGFLYLVLFTVIFLGSQAIIDTEYLEQQLGHPANTGSYVDLAWLASSLGTFAGALGSGLESQEAVYRAMYGRRERERRRRSAEARAEEEEG